MSARRAACRTVRILHAVGGIRYGMHSMHDAAAAATSDIRPLRYGAGGEGHDHARCTPGAHAERTARSRLNMPALTYVGPGENVLTFVPNIIGYARVVSQSFRPWCLHILPFLSLVLTTRRHVFEQLLLVVACYYMLDNPALAGVSYFLSGFLDHFDGAAARKYGQCSQFGATLDMVTDRVATTLLVRTAPFATTRADSCAADRLL